MILENKAQVIAEKLSQQGTLSVQQIAAIVLEELKNGGNVQLLEEKGHIHCKTIVRGKNGEVVARQG